MKKQANKEKKTVTVKTVSPEKAKAMIDGEILYQTHSFLISPDGDGCAICGVLPDDHTPKGDTDLDQKAKTIMSKAFAKKIDEELVALEDPLEESAPRSQISFGMKPAEPESTTKSEGEQPEKTDPPSKVEYAEEDERFRKRKEPEPDHKKIKRSMKKEQALDKRINLLARAKRFWTGGIETEGVTFVNTVRLFSVITAYLLNLFTVVVIVYLIVNIIGLLREDIVDYYQAIKICLTGAFIWMVVKIHEKVEV